MSLFHEIPRQHDMFTGELVDNRTSEQKRSDSTLTLPTQPLMFSQRDIVQIGVSPTPRMNLSPGRLVLIAEDPRSEEEIEQDRLKQAQALTADLFASVPTSAAPTSRHSPPPVLEPSVSPPSLETPELSDEDEANAETAHSVDPPPTKLAAYKELVRLAQERAMTIAIAPVSALAETISMSLAKFQAGRAGLTATEIATALLIGDFRGKQQVKASPSPTIPDESETTPPRAWDVPILWLNRTDLLKRRPDLTNQINSLSEYEVEAVAALVGQALEEFYWIQMNVVLSLYLDHEMALHLRDPKAKPAPVPIPSK